MKKIILILMVVVFGTTYSKDNEPQTQQEQQQTTVQPSNSPGFNQGEKNKNVDKSTKTKDGHHFNIDFTNNSLEVKPKTSRRVEKDTSVSFGFNQGEKIKNVDKSTKTKDGYDLNIEFTNNSMNKYVFTGFGTGFSQHPAYTIEKNGVTTKDVTFKSIPLYIIAKVYLAPESYFFRPFVKAVGGYSFNIGRETTQVTDKNGTRMEESTIKDGMYYGGGVGVQLSWLEISLMETLTNYTISDNKLKSVRTTLGFAVKL